MNRNVTRMFAMLVLGAGMTMLVGCGQSGVVVSTEEDRLIVADRSGKNATTYEIAPEAKITLDGQPAELEDLDPGDPVSVGVKNEGDKTIATAVNAESKELPEKPAPLRDDRRSPFPNESPFPEELVPPLTDRDGAEPEKQRPDGEPAPADEQGAEHAEDPPPPSADGDDRSEAGFAKVFAGEVVSVDEEQIVLRIGDEERAFLVTDATLVRVAGEEAGLDDVRAGQPAVVSAELEEDALVARVVEVEPTSAQ